MNERDRRIAIRFFVVGLCCGIILAVAAAKANSDTFQLHAESVLAGEWGPQPQWKLDLFREGLERGLSDRHCWTSGYNAFEAGADWKRWSITAFGVRLRPGMVCVHTSRWGELGGCYVWVSGYGIAKVADRDRHRSRRSVPWFDCYTQTASEARAWGLRKDARFVILKQGGQ